jgi:excisionase family DNA binding protein
MEIVEPTQPEAKASINPEAIYTIAEVAEYLGLSRPVIYELIDYGSLYMPPVNGKSRGKRFITGENIRRFAMGRPQEKE